MTDNAVIYEVDITLAADLAGEFDTWLEGHVAEMLTLPDFESAQTYADTMHDGEMVRRTVQYRVRSAEALEDYLAHRADEMQKGRERFAGRYEVSRRILRPSGSPTPSRGEQSCRNCGQLLSGQYCSTCGQRSNVRLITVWELARDVIGDLFELDSRLWRTVRPLLFKPGLLTREYLSGRRVHFVPPFRMYLVLSLAFFLVAAAGRNLEINGDAGDAEVPLDMAADSEDTDQGDRRAESPDPEDPGKPTGDSNDDSADPCFDFDGEYAWLEQRCTRIRDDPSIFGKQLLNNVPTMLFFFLPLIAFVMKVLYLGSGRYYVEHLLFFVHYHSFFFLILTLTVLMWRISDWTSIHDAVPGLITTAVVIYIPVYLFRAMRVVYGHGMFAGSVRYVLLLIAYLISLAVTFAATALITALTF